MHKQTHPKSFSFFANLFRGAVSLAFLFLLIEFFDELNFGVEGAALPALRSDLRLSYAQIGLLLGLPAIVNTLIEPVLMLLGDTRWRKQIMLGGGLAISLALLAVAAAPLTPQPFGVLMLAMIVAYPASGAFVTLAQATLMDLNPGREAQMMARWTVAGSLGNLIGPLLLAGGFALGWGWRWAYVTLAGACLLLVFLTWAHKLPARAHPNEDQGGNPDSLRRLLGGLKDAVRNPRLLRWMALLQLSDLLLDVLTGYLALYFTDVSGFSKANTSLLLSGVMLAGLVSNIILIPLLERIPGRTLVRLSAAAVIPLYAAWLLLPWAWAKVGLIILIKLGTIGWYEVLQGEAYAAVPGRSGTMMAINSLVGVLGGGIAWLVGWVAAQAGLPAAMWLLLLGPVCLVLFVPRHLQTSQVSKNL
jgi:FSR family fosmidomycin resistance protein-like MFS transporter